MLHFNETESIKVQRTSDMNEIEKKLMLEIWKDICDKRYDKKWYNYHKEFTINSKLYIVTLQFKLDNQFFTYRNLSIIAGKKTIIINEQ